MLAPISVPPSSSSELSLSQSPSHSNNNWNNKKHSEPKRSRGHRKTHPEMASSQSRYPALKIDTTNTGDADAANTPATAASSESNYSYTQQQAQHQPKNGKLRTRTDIRSPGAKATPMNASVGVAPPQSDSNNASVPIPDFITQTDRHGNAAAPRTNPNSNLQQQHGSYSRSNIANGDNDDPNEKNNADVTSTSIMSDEDPFDACLESLRLMCCCLLTEDKSATNDSSNNAGHTKKIKRQGSLTAAKREKKHSMLLPMDPNDPDRVKLLPKIHPQDKGKKCLVLDLDETLVHSSFRAVPGADFVIPVQIEDVVHFVYVAKRPGVDEFLLEMAKHYEIVIYTASLNKYADPLLDLLDPHRVIRTRLFRESCVYFEGNYVKDLSLIDRDLSQSIIVDNSPNSYLFHPDNAIDCSSFIDDPADRELMQIGGFLKNIDNAEDVRGICSLWKKWPDVDLSGIKRQENR